MSHTNSTTNYGLSQFIGTDKPAWLVDYNGDMSAIDSAIKSASNDASAANTLAGTADSKADTNALNISTLDGQINDPATGLAVVVGTLNTAVTSMGNSIGNTPLPTTAQTITGAIDEIHSESIKAGNFYQYVGGNSVKVTSDGVKTVEQLLNDLSAAYFALFTGLDGLWYKPTKIDAGGYAHNIPIQSDLMTGAYNNLYFKALTIAGTDTIVYVVTVKNTDSQIDTSVIHSDGTVSLNTYKADVPTSGIDFVLHYLVYSK